MTDQISTMPACKDENTARVRYIEAIHSGSTDLFEKAVTANPGLLSNPPYGRFLPLELREDHRDFYLHVVRRGCKLTEEDLWTIVFQSKEKPGVCAAIAAEIGMPAAQFPLRRRESMRNEIEAVIALRQLEIVLDNAEISPTNTAL